MPTLLAAKFHHTIQPREGFDGMPSEQADERMPHFGQFALRQEKRMTAITGVLGHPAACRDGVNVMSRQTTQWSNEFAKMILAGIRRNPNSKEHGMPATFANILTMSVAFANLFVRVTAQQAHQIMPDVYC